MPLVDGAAALLCEMATFAEASVSQAHGRAASTRAGGITREVAMSLWSDGIPMRGAQDLEDLATASWLTETFFAALDLDLFAALGRRRVSLVGALAARCAADGRRSAAWSRRLSDAGPAVGLRATTSP